MRFVLACLLLCSCNNSGAKDREIELLKAQIAAQKDHPEPPEPPIAQPRELPPGISPLEDRLVRGKLTDADVAAFVRDGTANRGTITYAHLKKNAERYKGKPWRVNGVIVEIHEHDGETTGRLVVNGYDPNAVVYFTQQGATDFVENTVVEMAGELWGNYTYESQAGWKITIPWLMSAAMTKRGGLDKIAGIKRRRSSEDDE